MNKFNIRFLSSVLVMSVLGMCSVSAAPSVKMLGTNTARVGTNTSVVRTNNTSTPTTQRLGSIRSTNLTSGTPLTINKVPTKANAVNSAEESRLSLGKYIHSTGVSAGTIKPTTGSASTAGISSGDFTNLADRVQNLENGKQDAISVGDGLIKTGNTISLDATAVQNQVETVLADDYYTADEIDGLLDNVGATSTYPSTTQQNVNYDSINVVDRFDENFDFTE